MERLLNTALWRLEAELVCEALILFQKIGWCSFIEVIISSLVVVTIVQKILNFEFHGVVGETSA